MRREEAEELVLSPAEPVLLLYRHEEELFVAEPEVLSEEMPDELPEDP